MPDMTDTAQKSRIAIVTGGSRGLGRSTALNLAERGVNVILTYQQNSADADSAVAAIEQLGRKAFAIQLDTGDIHAFPAFAEAVRGVVGDRRPARVPLRGRPESSCDPVLRAQRFRLRRRQ